MPLPPTLTGAHLRTHQTIFHHPASHNLGWRDVLLLFRQLGQVDEAPNGNLKVTRNGHTIVLPPPRTKDVAATDELMKIRDFLERSEKPAATPLAAHGSDHRWLVVLNHQEARVFRSAVHGTQPEQIRPDDADDTGRHGQKSVSLPYDQKRPVPHGFFGAVAETLHPAGEILLFGSGTGTANEMEQFSAWLKAHHPDLARRVTGQLIIDASHLTDAQLLAMAREFHVATQALASR